MAKDSAAALSSFDDMTATGAFTPPPTSLPGGSTPSPSPTGPTQAASTSSAGQNRVAGSGASNSGTVPSANIVRGEVLGMVCTVGVAMIIMIMMI